MNNYTKLQEVLKEIFEMDKADLDFGIYRIMNQKRDQVMDFIDRTLPKEIKDILAQTQSKDSLLLTGELDQLGKSLDNAGVVRESSPKYLELKQLSMNVIDTNALEQEVFSHLGNFFKRYYKEGDFISLRRYKKDVYAIPYEGEEVKLHWANHDQYYIKTSEYLKNYAFKLADGKKVHFQLKEASTEQNNNKTQGDAERRFAIDEDLPIEIIDKELYINFTYETHKKTVKQDDLTKNAFETIQRNISDEFLGLFEVFKNIEGKSKTRKENKKDIVCEVLYHHLQNFISRNTFDYFIHKDLSGFLQRELDFYIKNEVLFIDDINTDNPIYFTAQLSKIKALKTVASKIITFLAQIEDFQKKLWLKKKFVISTDYCITLDRIPEKYYAEIIENKAQLFEWKNLFAVVINDTTQLAVEQFLVLDTKHFNEEFKDKLLAEFDDLDKETDGLLINSENFQALNLINEKFSEKIKMLYIDPPYNTSEESFVYKNLFKHSSWVTMMENRLTLSRNLLADDGVIVNAIDDEELFENKLLLDQIYYPENFITNLIVQTNPRGRGINGYFATSHDYLLYYGKDINSVTIENQPLTESQKLDFKFSDQESEFRLLPFRRSGGLSTPLDRPNSEFSIYYDKIARKIVAIGGKRLHSFPAEYKSDEYLVLENGEVMTFSESDFFTKHQRDCILTINPIDTDGKRRVWRWSDREKILEHISVGDFIVNEANNFTIQLKDRIKDGRKPKTIWFDSKYDASSHGTILLENILGASKLFGYPKSIYNVTDSLHTIVGNSQNSTILDYFAGSGTSGHATIKLNRKDQGKRKYILVEMGTYFSSVTKPRIQKVIYSDNWKNGKPQDKVGISQMFKYQVLESYEDALNNLNLAKTNNDGLLQFSEDAQEDFLLKYMLDVESEDHLFNIQMFRNPFNYQLKVTENNELVPTKVDLVETFNYLIGMYVNRIQRIKDIKIIEGKTREGEKTLIIWRNLDTTTYEEVAIVYRKLYDSVRSAEFDQIYINGDHHFDNLRTGDDQFKVKLIEETFFKKMFNISEL
jgi:adenine-specific DNA-methyltransferase